MRLKQFYFLFVMLFSSFFVFADSYNIELLKGLRFYADPKETLLENCFSGIQLDLAVPKDKKFLEKMECFLGKPFTDETATTLKKEIISYYQGSGYPIVGVFIPSGQTFSCETVQVLILVARLGEVKAEGAKYFSNEKILCQFRLKPGDPIYAETVNEDLQFVNLNPYRRTTLVYEPGKEIGETDILLTTKDRFPLRIYGGYENTGNPLTGTPRLMGGINFGNLFGLDQEINYLFVTETNPQNWYAHIGSYVIPFPWRDQLRLYGSYTFSKPSAGGVDAKLKGKGWQVNGRYSTFFTYSDIDFTAYLGYEFKRTNNFLTFGVLPQFNEFIDISQFVLGIDGSVTYERGSTLFGVKFFLSPGNMTAYNKTSLFRAQREGAKSNYVYGVANIDQLLSLPYNFTFAMNSLFQASSTKLLPSEGFVLGGYYTVRGYDEYDSLSDHGILLKNEIRSPAISLPTFRKKQHELQFLTFWDFGVSISDDQQVIDNHASILSSVGPGLRYQFDNKLLVRIDWGVQLSHVNNLQTDSGRKTRLHSGVQLSF